MPQTPGDRPAYEPADVPPDAAPPPSPPPPPPAPPGTAPAGAGGPGPRRMPLWLPRAFALAGVITLAFLALLWLLARLRGLLLLVLVSLFLAFAIEPAVNRLAARGWRRGAATG